MVRLQASSRTKGPSALTFGAVAVACLLAPSCSGGGGTGGGTGTETGGGSASATAATASSSTAGGSATATGTSAGSASASGSTSAAATSADTGTASGTSAGSGSTGAAGSGSAGTTTGGGILECNGKVWACGNGIDDDNDGKVDADDPECTGPCDDDEGSFATGIPGDNMDCKQDCFFDGNSGSGDDKCEWDLRCDPENPGKDIGCPYTPGPQCMNTDPTPSPECKEFCEPLVPNGCDCYGCCRVSTPNGDVDIFLNGNPDCSLDNLDACQPCTYQGDICGNPCVPEDCEICFGQEELPPGCTDPTCPDGLAPCLEASDCPDGFFCQTGCCYPPPG